MVKNSIYVHETIPDLKDMDLTREELQDFCIELLIFCRKLQGVQEAQGSRLNRDTFQLEEDVKKLQVARKAYEAQVERSIEDQIGRPGFFSEGDRHEK